MNINKHLDPKPLPPRIMKEELKLVFFIFILYIFFILKKCCLTLWLVG